MKKWYMVNPKNKKYPAKRIFADSVPNAFIRYIENEKPNIPSTKRADYIIL